MFRKPHRSFSAKVLLLVILPTCLTIVSVMGIVLGLSGRLSTEVSGVMGQHMESLYAEFLAESSKETATDIRLQIEQITTELKILAAAAQVLIDLGPQGRAVGRDLQKYSYFLNNFVYNKTGNWSNLAKGEADVSLSVWGYQHDQAGRMNEDTRAYADTLAALKPLMNAMGRRGAKKGWLYVVGPRQTPFMFMYPWGQMPAIFDEKYPGHNTANWWDFFFPNMVEGWEQWLREDPARLSADMDLTTITPFYEDAGGTGLMLTFFYPLWSAGRDANHGAAAIDVNVDKIAGIVKDVRIGKTGFSFILTGDGDIFGLSPEREAVLEVRGQEGTGAGVARLNTNIRSSRNPGFATLALPAGSEDFRFVSVDGPDNGYFLALRKLGSLQRWNGSSIEPMGFFIASLAPKAEVFFLREAIKKEIANASDSSSSLAVLAIAAISALSILLSVLFALKGTKQIRLLILRAGALARGDFESEVEVVAGDELGQLAATFNRMTTDLSGSRQRLQDYATNLESLVAERTRELERANQRLEDLSRLDGLTGIGNRRHFDESLERLWRMAQREGRPLSLVLFDVDYFKKYNDLYGHLKGDDCLRRVAGTARDCARRPLDLVCRYGGEEFAVLLLGSRDEAALLGERIRQAVEGLGIPHAQGVADVVTVSLGVGCVEDLASDTPDALIARADAALYRSKNEGRNRLAAG
jgi:sigma-B regulation protein RsbU (phosphoserine phosphatase)